MPHVKCCNEVNDLVVTQRTFGKTKQKQTNHNNKVDIITFRKKWSVKGQRSTQNSDSKGKKVRHDK